MTSVNDRAVIRQTSPAELVPTAAGALLTAHVVAAIILLDVPPTIRALLRAALEVHLASRAKFLAKANRLLRRHS